MSKVWYIRDDATARQLSPLLDDALLQLRSEFTEGNSHGTLFCPATGAVLKAGAYFVELEPLAREWLAVQLVPRERPGPSARMPDNSSTVQVIYPPEAGPMPSICDGMAKADIWEYAHLCGFRAAGIADPVSARALDAAIDERLRRIAIGGCTCGRKTPLLAHHNERCHFRLASEVADLLRVPKALPVFSDEQLADAVPQEATVPEPSAGTRKVCMTRLQLRTFGENLLRGSPAAAVADCKAEPGQEAA